MTLIQMIAVRSTKPRLARLFTPLARAIRAVQRHRRIAMTIRVLERLDDHTLKDIGLPRREIRDLAMRLESSRCF